MKKLLLSAALCALLTSSAPAVAEDYTRATLEQRVEDRRVMKGFTLAERELLRKSERMISENYVTPEILFYNLGEELNIITTGEDSLGIAFSDTNIIMGRSPGLVEDALEYLPGDFPFEEYPDHYLVLLKNGYDYRNAFAEYEYNDEGNLNPLDKREQIPWDKNPMLSTTLHEIGHIYFEGLSGKEKQDLVDNFMAVDTMAQTFHESWAESLAGHACFHSQFYSIFSDGIFDEGLGLASEQFSDIFAYHILGHDYKQYDLFFGMKLEAVTNALERFRLSPE
jgi:hypothetical protein